MSSDSRISAKVAGTVAGITILGGFLAYAVYFDYKRRNDVGFRKQLRKQKKKVEKRVAETQSQEPEGSKAVSIEELKAALARIRTEPVPASPEAREQYFMSQVGMGETLCMQGPSLHMTAALCFFRALRVYPSPVELIAIYQKTVPEPVFNIVMELMNLDVQERVEGYYDVFPAKSMKVSVKIIDAPDGKGSTQKKKVLIVNEDIPQGTVIYKEQPLMTALDFDLQEAGTHCSQCFRLIQDEDTAISPDGDRLNSVYCSAECQKKHKSQSQSLLFSLENPVPEPIAAEMSPEDIEKRRVAQEAFVVALKENKKVQPLLLARFIARSVAGETAKLFESTGVALPPQDLPPTDGGDYSLHDHLERLRYLELQPKEGDIALLKGVFEHALPGLESFVTDERYAQLLGKIAFNSYGVCFDGGRGDRPSLSLRPEEEEKTRTPHDTSRQVGTGFYVVSSYIQHSCDPSCTPSFSEGTAELHLVANRDLKKGDEVTVAYVDVSQHEGESAQEARRRRRYDLARGWRFACTCDKCENEQVAQGSSEGEEKEKEEELEIQDGSKVDEAVLRVEAQLGQ